MTTNELILGNQQTALTEAATSNQAIQLAGMLIDKRIATARNYPRSVATFKREAVELLQNDIETAKSAEYAKPIGMGKYAFGPSVRLAELAALCWRNIEISIALPEVSETNVVVKVIAFDMERNYSAEGMSTTSILTKEGNRYSQSLIETTIMATAAKARRNAILSVIPRAYINELLEAAKAVADKHQPPMEERRKRVLDTFAKQYNVHADVIFERLGIAGADEINQEHMRDLTAISSALKEGEPIEVFFGKPMTKAEYAKLKLEKRRKDSDNGSNTDNPDAGRA